MPAPQLHLTFGNAGQRSARAFIPAASRLRRRADLHAPRRRSFTTCPTTGTCSPRRSATASRSPALDEPWAYRMHSSGPIASSRRSSAPRRTTPGRSRATSGWRSSAGLLSHCALDLTLHPLVNYCARRDTALLRRPRVVPPPASPRSITRSSSTSSASATIRSARREFREQTQRRQAAARSSRARGRAADRRRSCATPIAAPTATRPRARTWAGWVRSFRHFGALVSTPIRRRNSDAHAARPVAARALLRERPVPLHATSTPAPSSASPSWRTSRSTTSTPATSRAAACSRTRARIDDLAEPDATLQGLPSLPRLTVRCTPGVTAPPGQQPWKKRERRRLAKQEASAA